MERRDQRNGVPARGTGRQLVQAGSAVHADEPKKLYMSLYRNIKIILVNKNFLDRGSSMSLHDFEQGTMPR